MKTSFFYETYPNEEGGFRKELRTNSVLLCLVLALAIIIVAAYPHYKKAHSLDNIKISVSQLTYDPKSVSDYAYMYVIGNIENVSSLTATRIEGKIELFNRDLHVYTCSFIIEREISSQSSAPLNLKIREAPKVVSDLCSLSSEQLRCSYLIDKVSFK